MSGIWPESTDAVVRWVRDQLTADADFSGLDGMRISAELDGDDLARLTIDATGAELSPQPSTSASVSPTGASPEVRTRRPGSAREIRVIAAPMYVEGIALTIDVDVRDAPIDWVEYATPTDTRREDRRYDIRLRDEGRGMRGSLTASMRSDDVGPLIERSMRAALDTGDAKVRRLRVTVRQEGPDGLRVVGSAAIRYRLLFASARGEARMRVSADGVVTIEDLRVSSRNPLVALGLRVARRSLRAQIGRRFDLNESFGLSASGTRLHGVQLHIGHDLRLEARLG